MAARPVDERREGHRGHEGTRAEHRRFLPIGDALHVAANDLSAVGGRAREDDAEAVDQAAPGLLDGARRDVAKVRVDDELRDGIGRALDGGPFLFLRRHAGGRRRPRLHRHRRPDGSDRGEAKKRLPIDAHAFPFYERLRNRLRMAMKPAASSESG